MLRKPELARRSLTEQLGVGNTMPVEVTLRTERVSPVATVTTIQNQTPKRG